MSEYRKLEDVLHILDNVMSDEGIKHKGKAIRKRLKELPTEDVVEVVRCKDCEYCEHINDEFCKDYYNCKRQGNFSEKKAHDFCSEGKRKEGEE